MMKRYILKEHDNKRKHKYTSRDHAKHDVELLKNRRGRMNQNSK